MKKLDFGFNDDDRLNSQWAGIEQYNGEYLDMFSCDNRDFLVTKIVDSYRGLNGNIDVREIAQDYYADGGYMTYANKEKSAMCEKFELYLNKAMVKNEINSGKEPYNILRDAGFPVYMSHLRKVTNESDIVPAVITSIKPEMFSKLKESKRFGGRSMYDLTQEIIKLRAYVRRIEEEKQFGSNGRHY